LVRYRVSSWLVLGRYLVGTCRYSEYLLVPTKHRTWLQRPEKKIERYWYGTVR